RPVRLNAREALALGLGLRVLAAESAPEHRTALLELAARLDVIVPMYAPLPQEPIDLHASEDDLRSEIVDAVQQHRCIEMRYIKPGDDAPRARTIAPYTLLFGKDRK